VVVYWPWLEAAASVGWPAPKRRGAAGHLLKGDESLGAKFMAVVLDSVVCLLRSVLWLGGRVGSVGGRKPLRRRPPWPAQP
jgi:hypothetical protein